MNARDEEGVSVGYPGLVIELLGSVSDLSCSADVLEVLSEVARDLDDATLEIVDGFLDAEELADEYDGPDGRDAGREDARSTLYREAFRSRFLDALALVRRAQRSAQVARRFARVTPTSSEKGEAAT